MLLAVDGNQRIVGANRVARTSLLLDDRGLRTGVSLWTIFERDFDLFRRKDRTDSYTRLVVAGSDDSRPTVVTPPDRVIDAPSDPTNLHTRPSLDSISTVLKQAPSVPRAHGGLSAGAMRRVQEYMKVHLGESIDLSMLAGVAGLSVHHLHGNLSNPSAPPRITTSRIKRVEGAQEMLAQRDLSLSEIAYATGFSDQSHLTRHFRQMLGTTPREFRWSQR
jgi:AraC-like DNA-binding protein